MRLLTRQAHHCLVCTCISMHRCLLSSPGYICGTPDGIPDASLLGFCLVQRCHGDSCCLPYAAHDRQLNMHHYQRHNNLSRLHCQAPSSKLHTSYNAMPLCFLREQQADSSWKLCQTFFVGVPVLVIVSVCGNRLVSKLASHLAMHVLVVGER